MKKKPNVLQWVNRIIVAVMIGITLWYLYDKISNQDTTRLAIAFATIPVLLVPCLVKWILHYTMSDSLKCTYYLFCFCGLTLGSILNWYAAIGWFDLFVHFLSGALASFAALIFLKRCHLTEKKSLWFQVMFTVSFALAIGVFWEFFEFTCDAITGGDTQHVADTGVDDTMTDMLIAFAGCVFYTVIYIITSIKGKEKTKAKILESI